MRLFFCCWWFYFQINTFILPRSTNRRTMHVHFIEVRDKARVVREILIMHKFYRTYFQENDIDNKLNKQHVKYKVQFSGIWNNKNRNSREKNTEKYLDKNAFFFFSLFFFPFHLVHRSNYRKYYHIFAMEYLFSLLVFSKEIDQYIFFHTRGGYINAKANRQSIILV